jgi:hypothetical protein
MPHSLNLARYRKLLDGAESAMRAGEFGKVGVVYLPQLAVLIAHLPSEQITASDADRWDNIVAALKDQR